MRGEFRRLYKLFSKEEIKLKKQIVTNLSFVRFIFDQVFFIYFLRLLRISLIFKKILGQRFCFIHIYKLNNLPNFSLNKNIIFYFSLERTTTFSNLLFLFKCYVFNEKREKTECHCCYCANFVNKSCLKNNQSKINQLQISIV